MNKIAIIGAGPAGLAAACFAGEYSVKNNLPVQTVIYEKKKSAGSKLLISGSGQCNVTNISPDSDTGRESFNNFLSHYGNVNQQRFLRNAYYAFSNRDTMNWFESGGTPMTIRSDGKVFPASFSAADIQQHMLSVCEDVHIRIICHYTVSEISKSSDSGLFTLTFSDKSQLDGFSGIIVTTGGRSYPNTGSEGDGYRIADQLGHTVINPEPALSGVTISDHALSSLAGISVISANMRLWRGNKKILERDGDVLITHTGFSGPVIINNSRLMRKGDELSFSFLQDNFRNMDDVKLREFIRSGGNRSIGTVIRSLVEPRRLADTLLALTHIPQEKKCSDIEKKSLYRLVELLTSWRQQIASAGKFSTAMVTAGGISLKEVSPKTMQSRIVSGLFFAGEVLDIDGDTGGYNIQAAFSTGRLAGISSVKYVCGDSDDG